METKMSYCHDDLIKISKKWNKLKNDKDRFDFLLLNKDHFLLTLDNDQTLISFHYPGYEDIELKSFKEFLGYSDGISILLTCLGIKHDFC
jgi:hypothetical protein